MNIDELRKENELLMREPSSPSRWQKEFRLAELAAQLPEYSPYHKQCVDACAQLMGEENRPFFDACSFKHEFLEAREPEDVAGDQQDALSGEQ